VEDTFDPSASGWSANLAVGTKSEFAKGREFNAARAGADVREVKDEVDERVDDEVEGKEEVAAEKDEFAEKLEANDDESGASESAETGSDDEAPKSFPVSSLRCVTLFFSWRAFSEMKNGSKI
jgi:hypothetical protein